MTYSYFRSVAKWACNKMGGNAIYVEFCKTFRESSKNHSRIYFEGVVCDVADKDDHLLKPFYVGVGIWNFKCMYSWSFETFDFKPARQSNADILVFRYKEKKGQKKMYKSNYS